jgi:5-methylcytosine-specific restriction endonuclease McrA
VEPRSSFGSTTKDEQDHVSNLVALCRSCHNAAHSAYGREFKIKLKGIIQKRETVGN